MNRFLQLACVASATYGIGVWSADATFGGQEADKAALEAAVGTIEKGWNAYSGDQFASPFMDDADYVVVNGMRIKGRKAIAQGHDFIFKSSHKGTVNSHKIESIRFPRPDVGIAHVRWTLKYPDGKVYHAMNSMVFLKEGSDWNIANFHNTPILGPG